MAAITALTKDFDGADGVAITTAAQIGASKFSPGSATAKFNAAHAVSGTTCWELDCGTGNTMIGEFAVGSSKALVWTSHYGTTPSALPSATETIYSSKGDTDTNTAVSVRWMTDGSVQLRDNATTHTGGQSPAGLLPANTDYRIAVKSQPGGVCRAKVYVGANKHGAITNGVADWDSGDLANTSTAATGVDTIWLGALTSQNGSSYIDRLRADDAVEPQPAVTVGPPTVNAGPDVTKDVSSGNFTITETDAAVGSATIASRAWTQVNGPTLTLSGTTTATVTVTALTATGTAVIRCTVTDSNGATGSDDVSLNFVVPGVVLVPVGDVSNGGSYVNQAGSSSSLFQSIDENPVNTADFITTPQAPTAASYKCRLTAAVAPTNQTGVVVEVVLAIATDVTSYSFVYKLYDGDGTLKKTFTAITTGLSTTPSTIDLSLTAVEVASFSHWDSGLILERLMTAA